MTVDQAAGDDRRDNLRHRGERLREAQHDALLALARFMRDQRRDGGSQDTAPVGSEGHVDEQLRDGEDPGEPDVGNGGDGETGPHERALAQPLHQPSDQSALQDDAEETDVSEQVTHFFRADGFVVPGEAGVGGGNAGDIGGHQEERTTGKL